MTSRPLVAVLDYGIGNLRSAQKAFEFLGAEAVLTKEKEIIKKADGVVLPGVGAFGRAIDALSDARLLSTATALGLEATEGGRPFLGICIGMQLLFEGSHESEGIEGLKVIEGQVKLLKGEIKRPQMQWNRIDSRLGHPMFDEIPENPWLYFVHSYVAPISEKTVATCIYGEEICAAVAIDNLWATQFHPEKSGKAGLEILKNFLTKIKKESK